MNLPMMEKRRVKISSGSLPAVKVASLAACHPFSEQLDVVFPSNPALLSKLESLKTSYGKGKARLVDIVDNAQTFINPHTGDSRLIVVSVDPYDEDVWCIDPRGHLTASLSKETFERAGIHGQKLPYKHRTERYVIDIPLQHQNASQSVSNREKQKAGMERWGQYREANWGIESGLWSVVYCATDRSSAPSNDTVPFQSCQVKDAIYQKNELADVFVPVLGLSTREPKSRTSSLVKEDDDAEDWNRHVESLFEWVGMACMGAQRLFANDRVDSYVAIYEPPERSRVQNVTQLRWRGLLSPTFVKEVLDLVILSVQTSQQGSNDSHFVAVICQALTNSPVSYIPYSAKTGELQNPERVPPKLPRTDGGDTWSLIVEPARQEGDGDGHPQWCLMESVGQWDSRWG